MSDETRRMEPEELDWIETHARQLLDRERRPGVDEGRKMLLLVAEVRRFHDLSRRIAEHGGLRGAFQHGTSACAFCHSREVGVHDAAAGCPWPEILDAAGKSALVARIVANPGAMVQRVSTKTAMVGMTLASGEFIPPPIYTVTVTYWDDRQEVAYQGHHGGDAATYARQWTDRMNAQ